MLISTAEQSNCSLVSHSCSVSMCVWGWGCAERQDYENQSPSPSLKAEVWLSAYRPVLIRLACCDTESGARRRTGPEHVMTGLDSHTWHQTTVALHVHPFCYLWHHNWVGSCNSANAALWLPIVWPGHGCVGIPCNKTTTATRQLTLNKGDDDWTRSGLTAGSLAG